jgi:hypothetical protein
VPPEETKTSFAHALLAAQLEQPLHAVAFLRQRLREMRSDEAGASQHQTGSHSVFLQLRLAKFTVLRTD